MARELVREARQGTLNENDIDEAMIARNLPSYPLRDPDLIIRTSGERRLSNFFLWQAAYSEIEFEAKAWPDFTTADLDRILGNYAVRERRYGRISEQLRPG